MKDLTHYFASPPKSVETIETSSAVVIDNLENRNELTESGKNDVLKKRREKSRTETTTAARIEEGAMEVEPGTTIVEKKRSRVKIRISLKDSERNHRCDIIDSKNDFVDKTPSPFNKRCSKIDKSGVTTSPDNEAPETHREETPNAFQLLMTRNKNPTTTSTASSQCGSGIIDNECSRARPKQSKDKLVVLAESTGYAKRKHAEIEEGESVEKRTKKRARMLKKGDEKTEEQQTGKKKIKAKKTKQKKKEEEEDWVDSNGNEAGVDARVDHRENDDERKRNRKSEAKVALESGKSFADDCSSFLRKDQQTSKFKPKWAMRVKLQSHSDDDERGDNGGDTSDEEYIFTPKSKTKFQRRRRRTSKTNGERETREERRAGDEREDSWESSKRGKHRAKKNQARVPDSDVVEETRSSDVSVEILECNTTGIYESQIKVQGKKLAPLFVRRSKPNPAAVEARKSFLKSGIPEAVKKIISDQKPSCNDAGTSAMPFPRISHVSRSSDEEGSSGGSYGALYKEKSGLREAVSGPAIDLNSFKSLSDFSELGTREEKKAPRIERESFETVLREVESRCSDARRIWERVSLAGSNRAVKRSPKKRGKKLKLQKKQDDVISTEEENPDNLNPTWTCKYKPTSSVEVVGNEQAVAKLRNWLSGWKLPTPKEDRSSGDEFYSSDCSSTSYYENNQVAVLIGPHGGGKTASVYAVAEELGYRVLEVNASSRRTGKKIMTDFQEATKSHRVKRNQSNTLVTTTAAKKPLERRVPQNSLILIEDVDLIFEEDEGFVSATFQLAANTRRPIVMTCKEACGHLNRMAPQQQIIHFQTATGNRVAALLELIALSESGYRLPRCCSDILLRNGDLRQSLLQLQYILLSGSPSISQLGTSRGLITWPDMQPMIYKPAIKSSKKNRKEFSDVKLRAKEDEKLVNTLANKLDTVSLISSLTDVENPAPPPWRRKLNSSLSLLEDFKPYSNSADLGAEIADWLGRASIGSEIADEAACESNLDFKAQLGMKRKVKLGIDLALGQAIPSTLEHRSKSMDYLPVIRTMCRSEQERASINTKRGNRFHNYLHGLNLASASSNILAAASSVFKDKYS